ncbi:MAG: gfo/Idh/MocA family oxidoreductase, partial [Candidatus Hydrogenedens sp.]
HNTQTYPIQSVVKYHFSEREDMGPVDIYWYDKGNKPQRPADIPAEETIGDGDNGSLFIGTHGYLTAGEYGGKARLLPESRMNDYKKPNPMIPRISGSNHYRNWLEACKGGEPACSNFDYAAPLTEVVLLGCIAQRLNRKVTYNMAEGKFIGDDEANAMLTKPYREGWAIPA